MQTILPGADPAPSAPPGARKRFGTVTRVVRSPLEHFFRMEVVSGITLLLAAVVAFGWANSPAAETYFALWNTPIGFDVPHFEPTLAWLVNDGVMVIFFFLVGLELRSEIHDGALSDPRRAVLPVVAAIGGMVAPAVLYLTLAAAPEARSGWGVPMATDIAFAIGVLSLLGRRVPPRLRVLLLALAAIDDLGAIIVIAFFYSSGIATSGLVVAALAFGSVFLLQRCGVRSKLAYVPAAVITWIGLYSAGVHPTIAGVLFGLATPVRTKPPEEGLSPARSMIDALHPWVAFGIMPLFALVNAGVAVDGKALDATSASVFSGVMVGLLLGKPVGVIAACLLAIKTGIGTLPEGLGPRDLVVLGLVAGIGFTMSLFVAQLAFTDATLLAAAKLGILTASGAAAVLGLAFGVASNRATTGRRALDA